jgi:hypothetical protein
VAAAGGGAVTATPVGCDSTVGVDENLEDMLDSHDGLRDGVECALLGDGEEAGAGCPVPFAGEGEDVGRAGAGLERFWVSIVTDPLCGRALSTGLGGV